MTSAQKAAAAFIALATIAAAALFAIKPKAPAPEPEPVAASTPAPEVPAAPVEPLPPLGDSDYWVRDRAGVLSAKLAPWLKQEGLLRRFAAAVDIIAEGASPRESLGFLSPKGKFKVRKAGGRVTADPASYARYDGAADVLTSVDPAAAGRLARRLQPLLDQASAEQGVGPRQFEERLTRALRLLLAVPVVTGDLVLKEKVVTWAMAEPELESLSDAQKHLLRMGPRNVERVQAWLRAFADGYGVRP